MDAIRSHLAMTAIWIERAFPLVESTAEAILTDEIYAFKHDNNVQERILNLTHNFQVATSELVGHCLNDKQHLSRAAQSEVDSYVKDLQTLSADITKIAHSHAPNMGAIKDAYERIESLRNKNPVIGGLFHEAAGIGRNQVEKAA